jgi:hypothetical protein
MTLKLSDVILTKDALPIPPEPKKKESDWYP